MTLTQQQHSKTIGRLMLIGLPLISWIATSPWLTSRMMQLFEVAKDGISKRGWLSVSLTVNLKATINKMKVSLWIAPGYGEFENCSMWRLEVARV